MRDEILKKKRLLYQKERDASDFHKTRQQALERDGFKCQLCGSTDQLRVHHIVPFVVSKDSSINNLITLCGNCHKKVHSDPQPKRWETQLKKMIQK